MMNIFVLENEFLKITLSDFGASWLSCIVKSGDEGREVLVTTSPAYWRQQSAYFGATIGRYANRIANGQYQLNGKTYTLAQNNGKNNLHGGERGADKVQWQLMKQSPQAVKFAYTFANGEEGFGGEVQAEVEYRLNGKQLDILFQATSDQDTPLCLTNHAYFNLQGYGNILEHNLQINADYYLPVDENGIPNAPLKSVEGTSFDFRRAKVIGRDLLADDDQRAVKGYDHAFQFAKVKQKNTACLSVSDLSMELTTTMPAVQLYTGNWLAGQPNQTGGKYDDYAGVALEPEFFPDCINQKELLVFGGITKAGELYQHSISYKFVY